ncbi:MAG: two-component system response regulator [Gammaproteobacteria bacterium]|nr:MAG: two-component system response regulator [Gammaproteobacteria bacterium]
MNNAALSNKDDLTILLVDDDDLDAMAVERMLNKLDAPPKLVRVCNGYQALEKLQTQTKQSVQPPYLVLLDLNMPKMNGIEFLAEVRKDPKLHASVIFVLTTSSADQDKVAAYGNHIAGYIVKSEVGPDYNRLANMLDHYRNTISLLH